MNNKIKPVKKRYETLHDQSLSMVNVIILIMIIYWICHLIKCIIKTKSLTTAFLKSVISDAAPFIFVPCIIAIIIFFLDWAIYTAFKNAALKHGKVFNGYISKEIKQSRINRNGGYTTYRYIVDLDNGEKVKSTVYMSQISEKKCVVHKHRGIVVLTDFE